MRKISRAQFYQLIKKGMGPESYTAGRGRYVSAAADRRWEERMEELERQRKQALRADSTSKYRDEMV